MIEENTDWIKQNTFVDAKDKEGDWQIGYVLSINKNNIKIRFDGYLSKFDEIYQSGSHRLRPFRSLIRGYTGLKKNPGIRQHWKFSEQTHQLKLKQFDNFIQSISQKSADQINQYLRGFHYLYIDFLLTITYTSKSQIEKIYQYFQKHINFTLNYLKQLCNNFPNKWFNNKQQNQNYKAYTQGYYQYLDSFYSILGGYPRLNGFFKNNQKYIKQMIGDNLPYQAYITNMLSQKGFGKIFQKCLLILQQHISIILPIPFLRIICQFQTALQKFIPQKDVKKNLAMNIYNIINKQLNNLNANIVKYQQKQLQQLFSTMKILYFKYYQKNQIYLWIQITKLNMWCIMLLIDSLQKRLRGISKLKQFIQILATHTQYGAVVMNKIQFQKWLQQKQLLKIIFEHNQHSQVIRKGCQLAKLFYVQLIISYQQLLFIWNVCKSKHEAVQKCIYQMWIQLLFIIRLQQISKFVQVILQLTLQNHQQKQFLFEFTQKMIKKYQNSELTHKLLQLCYNQVIIDQNWLKQFAKILSYSQKNKSTLGQKFIQKCFSKIQIKQNNQIHLHLLGQIISQFYGKQVYIPDNAIQILIHQIKIILQQINHQHNLRLIFKLINQILLSNDNQIQLNQQQFKQLWDIFNQIQSQSIKSIFYQWLLYTCRDGLLNIQTHKINNNFQIELITYIFRNILLDSRKLDYINMSELQFQIFMEFLLQVNKNSGKIETILHGSGLRFFRVKDMQIQGTRQLWSIFFNCKNQKVIESLATFLKSLHLNLSDKLEPPLRLSRIDALLCKLDKNIKQGIKKSNIKLIKHSLKLLLNILSDITQKYKIPRQLEYTLTNNKTQLNFFENSKQIHKIQISVAQSLISIKNKIGKYFKINGDQFILYNNNEQIYKQYYILPYFSLGINNGLRIVKIQNHLKKFILTFIKDNIYGSLVDLLSNQNVCYQSFTILQEIPSNNSDSSFLTKIIQKNYKLSTQSIYFNYYFIRLFMCSDFNSNIKLDIFNKIINQISFDINNQLSIQFGNCYLQIYLKMYKQFKLPKNQPKQYQRIFNIMLYFLRYVNKQNKITTKKHFNFLINCYQCLQILLNYNIFKYIINHPQFQQFINLTFIQHKYDYLKTYICNKYQQCFKNVSLSKQQQIKIINLFIQKLFSKILTDHINMKQYITFFRIVKSTINIISYQSIQKLTQGQNSFSNQLFQTIVSAAPQTYYQVNSILQGCLLIETALCNRNPNIITQQMAKFVLYDCLFYDKIQTKINNTKCKVNDTIAVALQLLRVFFKHNFKIYCQTIKYLTQMNKISYWRTSYNWAVAIQQQKKSVTGYVGIQNPGCMCYLNSFMQQLFLMQSFKNHILYDNIPKQKQINYQLLDNLKLFFLKLQYSQQQSINPIFFSKSIKNSNNKSIIKINQQMDIDQFCSILLDKIQSLLQSNNNFIRNLFGGIYSNQIISKQCTHSSQRQQTFLSISLEVKKSIIDSFQSLVKGQTLQGQNAYFCQRCDKKVKAVKRLSLKKLPPILLISLKRFQFNYQIDSKIKINDYCQFGNNIDLSQFSQHKIHINQNLQLDINQIQLPSNYFKYKLKGIVVHTGFADSGHYYSYIQGNNQKWFEFNDNKVFQFDPKKIPQQAFGGKDGDGFKIKNAYILIYQRQDIKHGLEMQIQQTNKKQQSQQNIKIISQIIQNNKIIDKFHLLFSQQYLDFINNIKILNNTTNSNEFKQLKNNILLTYFQNIKLRSRDLTQIYNFADQIQSIFQQQPNLSYQYLVSFHHPILMNQIFIYATGRDKVKIASCILTSIAKKFLQTNPIIIQNQQSSIQIPEAIKYLINNILRSIVRSMKNISELCFILRNLSNSNIYILDYLIAQNTINILLDNFLDLNNSKEDRQKKLITLENHFSEDPFFGEFNAQDLRPISKSPQKQGWHLLCLLYLRLNSNKEAVQNFDKKLINISIGRLNQMIQDCRQTKSMIGISQFFCIISQQNYKMTQNILNAIQKSLKDLESSKYRPFLLILYKLIQINDSLKQYRIKKIINLLSIALNFNTKYFLQCDILQQWIIKIACHSQEFIQQISTDQIIQDIIKWIVNNKPSSQTLKKHKNPHCQRLQLRLHGILVSAQVTDYEKLIAFKLNKFQQIRRHKFKIVQFQNQPILQQNFTEGCSVRYFHENQWIQGIASDCRYGLIKVQAQGVKKRQQYKIVNYIWEDNQRVKLNYKDKNQGEINMDQ